MSQAEQLGLQARVIYLNNCSYIYTPSLNMKLHVHNYTLQVKASYHRGIGFSIVSHADMSHYTK